MPTLFLSDAHLSELRPVQLSHFQHVLTQASALGAEVYILGDLVEFWPGDDDDAPFHREIVAALARFSAAGGALKVALGNRDFLLGERFSQDTGAGLLEDYTVIELAGEKVLIGHGDLLCTRDLKYQAFRGFVRNPSNQQQFLAAPLAERRRIAAQTREGTQASMTEKDDQIMDVEETEVRRVMAANGASVLIHGHTHRPGVHSLETESGTLRRYVLGDWYEEGIVLWVHEGEYQLLTTSEFLALA
ncbi:MAG: UDP-2,3-diacylglucosamine diphosphatase [Gammaproteobacteria bacterium]|nr:UDP-2,3-diacylglucosamine diphosphatase [Gammaproteobacteria bacterium]